MNIAAPECVMSVTTEKETGRVEWVSVCANCQKEKNETGRLRLWVQEMRITSKEVSHGICPAHVAEFKKQVDELHRNG